MLKLFRHSLAAAALITAGAASAGGVTVTGSFNEIFNLNVSAVDTIAVMVSGTQSQFDSLGFTISSTTTGPITFDGVLKNGNWWVAAFNDRLNNAYSLSAGDYTLEVTGKTLDPQGVGEFAITTRFATVTPVPEPESIAMLLAGLGVVGFAARRRKPKAESNDQALIA